MPQNQHWGGSLNVELLRKTSHHLLEQLHRISAHGARKGNELKHIHTALRSLYQRYESLILAELLRDLSLIQASSFPSLEENIHKVFVSAGENRLGHASLD